MAQTYEQWKKSYESLDDAQKKQYADIAQSKGADYIGSKYLAQYNSASASASTPKTTTSTPKVETVTYKGQVTDNGNTSGTSNMNSMSQSSAINNSRNAQVNTGYVVDMPKQQTTSLNQTSNDQQFATSWNSLSAAQQQAALTKKGMLDYVNSKGLTIKKEEPAQTTTTTPTTPKKTTTTAQTPKQQEWDYQDNSQARMNQILNNLNGYRQTNPELFNDGTAFYNFFIKDKGRSQDQIDYLWDYFNNVQKYSKYDTLSPDAIGSGLADGSIPQDYLDYLKSVDPNKYQQAVSAYQYSQDTIKYENYLDDLSSMAGYESEKSNVPEVSDPITYAKKMGYLVDEDGNWVDDNLYVQPTDEERQDIDRINEINARRMEIKNMQKNLLDDLVEQYPGVPKATLMGIVQDRTKDISREYDDLGVELVQLQGTVDYLQKERDMQSEARQQTIDNLDSAYGMYYQYSPGGLAELAQSKYAATNITLDQADSGNETQKQMALQNVLDGYYDKYGDIIERSEQQVINDVIAYAKKNGIGLAQALDENFVQPLQSKPEFATLSSGRSITSTPTDKWAKLSDDMLYNTVTGEIRNVNGDIISQGTYVAPGTKVTNASGKSYTVVTDEQLIAGLDGFLADKNIGDVGGECGAFINNGLKSIGVITENIYDNSKESKLNSKNEDVDTTAQTGWVAIRNPDKLTGNGAKYGHVGFVIQDNGDGTVKVLDSNGTKNAKGEYDKTIGVRDVPKSSLYGYFNPTKGTGTGTGTGNGEDDDLFSAKVLAWIPTQLRNTDVEKKWYLDIAEKQKAKGLSAFETAMAIMGFDITNDSTAAQNTKQKILDVTMAQGDEIAFNSAVLSSMAQSINKGDYEGALRTLENQMSNLMASKGSTGLDRDNVSAGIKAIDGLNEITNYKSWGKGSVATVKEALNAEGKDTSKFYSWVSNLKSTLRALGYDSDDIDNMVPKITYEEDEFKEKVTSLEDAILGKYNQIRKNRGMPEISRDALLGDKSLSSIYQIITIDKINPSQHNLNARYSISPENEAFAAI